ncbi:M15 family metallopeptidase [Cellulosilyticum sp. I15G10I2]|uniref:M15 family metallopeptidase n=1 Tax=Cellulosilyticum sp. I15G10I2 TaxID=1892843 RepID=UPI00085CBB0D|nr:M15 family metallopeptidase [Cellulosilyticum sp. I15G10I2]
MATVACRDINKLTPETKILCLRFLAECKAQGLNIGISETWRSEERQKEMIKSGASKITRSKHMDGLAFDFYNNQVGNLYPDDIMRKCGAIGKKLGLYWGGDFKGFYDSCHLENNNPVGTIKAVDDQYIKAVNKLVDKGVIGSPEIWKEKKFTKDNVESLIIKFAGKL